MLTTVLFSDIVGSTAQAAEAGDRHWRHVLDDHDQIVRAELSQYRGREISTTGDGFFASFDGPAWAVRCGVAITEAVRRLGVEVRVGVHTGECEARGADLAGIAVHIGARVASLAGPGEVLVTSTVATSSRARAFASSSAARINSKASQKPGPSSRSTAPPRREERRCQFLHSTGVPYHRLHDATM